MRMKPRLEQSRPASVWKRIGVGDANGGPRERESNG